MPSGANAGTSSGSGGTPDDNSVTSAKIVDGAIVNADINASAAVAYSKLALTGSILNADVNASAAIAYSKLALTGAVLNADLAGSIAASKITGTAVTAADTGSVTSTMILDGTIVTGDLNAAAGITSGQLAGSIAASKVSGTAITAADAGTVTSTMIARTNALSRTGAIAETFHRESAAQFNAAFAIATGTLYLFAIELPINLVIGHITFVAGTTPLSGGTHQWFGLYNSSRVQLATTTDDTSTAWSASTEKTLAIATIASGASSTFTTTYSGLHYVGILVTGTTPTILAANTSVATLSGLAPILFGSSDTSQTTPPSFAHTATSITALANLAYVWLSA